MSGIVPGNIKMVIFDVDGVLTDGGIIINDYGEESKCFNAQDGSGIKYLARAGLKVALISGRQSSVVALRARELGIEDVYQREMVKLRAFRKLLEKHGMTADESCYVGDDLPDVPVMRKAGFPVAVANARPEVKAEAAYVTTAEGGRGAAREVAELILKDLAKWESVIARYYQDEHAGG